VFVRKSENKNSSLFTVVCDVIKFTERHPRTNGILEELDKAQVDIVHVPANRKNAADEKLKQLMRRFVDIHRVQPDRDNKGDDERKTTRIVLISGDMDFTADIADIKRRMRLSVILLHTNNCSQSLIHAASEHYNFQQLMSNVEIRQDLLRLQQVNNTVEVSNLPSISKDFTNKDLQNILYEIASTFSGQVQSISVTQGTAEIKFETHSLAFDFKKHYIHHKIKDRPINIHFKNKYRCGNKSTSSDKMLEVRPAFRKLTLESPAETRSESSITVTSEDEEPRSSRMHTKMRSKLKLKNRKKSKATEGFLKKSLINDVDSEQQTSPDNNDSDDQHENLVCEKIRDNLIQLINNHQLLRLNLIIHLYTECYQTDVERALREESKWSGEPHVVTKHGTFVQQYLTRVNQVLYKCLKNNNYGPNLVSVPQLRKTYKETYGHEAFLDIDLVVGAGLGVKYHPGSDQQGQQLLHLNNHFILGNEIIDVLEERGGIVPLDSFLGAYKSFTDKNLDPTEFGFNSVENLISNLHWLVSMRGRSVVLKSLDNQMETRERSCGHSSKPDVVAQTRDEDGRLFQLAKSHGNISGSAMRSLRQETMFKTSKLKLTGFINENISTEDKDAFDEKDEEVMTSTNTGDIVTVETDASDIEINVRNDPTPQKGRKKSRMAAFPFLD